jgi:hypothetical protein
LRQAKEKFVKKQQRIKVTLVSAIMLTALTGCISNPPQQKITPEQQAQAYEMRQALIERIRNGNFSQVAQRAQPKVVEPVAEVPKVSEQDLMQQISSLNKNAISGVKIERVRDGLKINDQAYLDPEGAIIDFAANPLNGNIVYVLKVNQNTRIFKYMNAGSNNLPVTLGKAVQTARNTVFYTASGQTLNGHNVLPTSTGVLVIRPGSAFNYVPGNRIASVVVPDNYHVASVQRGDVGSTKYILLEKNPAEKSANPFGSLLSKMNAISSTLGASKVDDYVLYNIETHNQVTLDVSAEGKSVAQYANCKKVNFAVNECSSVNFYKSLYQNDGRRNIGHYYWRVAWFNTQEGVFAVAGEGGARQVNVINLNERKRATVLERVLGINGYNTDQLPDGTIAIEAKMGFSVEKVSDAVEAYHKSEPVIIAKK